MPFFYLSYVYSFFFLSFVKERNLKYLLWSLLIPFIIVFSIRSSPDEYGRYLELTAPDSLGELTFGIGSQWLFNLLCLICKNLPYTLTSLYLIGYSLTFFLLDKSIKILTNHSNAISFFSIGFYLCHFFITFYEGLRGGLANILVIYAICYFIKSYKKWITILLLYLAISTHIQTIPVLIIFLIYFAFDYVYLKLKLISFKQKKEIIFLIILVTLISTIFFRSNFGNYIIQLIIQNISYVGDYSGYIGSEFHIYTIDLTGFAYMGVIANNIFVLIISYSDIFKINNTRYRILFFAVLFGQIISLAFSDLALLSYRFSSPFLYFQIPLIAATLRSNKMDKNKLPIKKMFLLSLGLLLSFFNVFTIQKLKQFSF